MTPTETKHFHSYVRQCPCIHCGRYGFTEVAHYHGPFSHVLGRGVGRKASDLVVAPLCRGWEQSCHAEYDGNRWCSDIEDSFERAREQSHLFLKYAWQTLIQYEEAGGISWRRVA